MHQDSRKVFVLFKKSRDLVWSLLDVTETIEDHLLIILNLCMGEEVLKALSQVDLLESPDTSDHALLSNWMASLRLRSFRNSTTQLSSCTILLTSAYSTVFSLF